MKGIAFLSVVPMRKEPSDRSEIVNQVIYGETFAILEQQEKWSKIRLQHDKYEGWIDNKQWQLLDKKNKETSQIVHATFIKNQGIFFPAGALVNFEMNANKKKLLATAKLFLEAPYLWGGRTVFGIDCSGFTQIVFRIHGIELKRDAYQQQTQGKKVAYKNVQNNDLAFFANADGKIIHVGIIFLEKNEVKIIHAAGKVRIDTLSEDGIINETSKTRTHQLHSIKRIN